jgi:hypothetical protein
MTAKVFRSFRDLKLTLGRLDAAHELAELALLRLDDEVPSPVDYEQYVFQLSQRFGLHVRPQSSTEAHRVVALSGIATAHSCYEEFLTSLAADLIEFGGPDLQLGLRDADTSKHDHVVKQLKRGHLLNSTDAFIVLDRTMVLHRLIRNSQAHRGREIPRRIAELTNQLRSLNTWPQAFPRRQPPNDFFELCFDDFLLFTQASRDMAEHLAFGLRPTHQALSAHPDFVRFSHSGDGVTDGKRILFLADRFSLDESDARDVLNFC